MADFRKSDGKHDDPLAGLTARTLGRSAAPASACPDASVIAAYFERALSDAEIAQHEQHFAGCARCQQQLAVMAQLETAVPASATDPSRSAERSGWRRAWNWKLWAPAAVAFGALALWIVGTSTQQMRAPATFDTQMAENRQPALAPPAGGALSADAVARQDAPAKSAAPGIDSMKTAEAAGNKRDESMFMAGRSATDAAKKDFPRVVAPPPPPLPARDAAQAEEEKALAKLETSDEKLRDAQKSKEVATAAERAAAPPAAAPVPQAAAPAESKPTQAQAQAEPRAAQPELRRQRQGEDNRGFAGALSTRNMQMKVASEIVIHAPAPSLVVWRITAGSKLEKSADSGGTWRQHKLPADVSILAGSAASEKIVWLVGRAGVILRTADGGEKWEKLVAPAAVDFAAIDARDAENATVVAADGRRFVTADAGRTWRLL